VSPRVQGRGSPHGDEFRHLGAEDKDCRDFQFQEDAQAVLDQDRSDPHRLDRLGEDESDGIA
jgi:hypothetical protein